MRREITLWAGFGQASGVGHGQILLIPGQSKSLSPRSSLRQVRGVRLENQIQPLPSRICVVVLRRKASTAKFAKGSRRTQRKTSRNQDSTESDVSETGERGALFPAPT